MSSAACFLQPLLLAFLCVLSVSCIPITPDLRSVISGVSDRDWTASAGAGEGRHLVKRQLSINADMQTLAKMLMAQQAEDDRRNQDFLRKIGKRGGLEVDMVPRAGLDSVGGNEVRFVRYIMPSSSDSAQDNALEDTAARMW